MMEQLFFFETLLFYQRRPCYYKIYRSGEMFIGEPTAHHYYISITFPHFIIRREKSGWKVEGITESATVKQLLHELERHLDSIVEHT